MKRRRLFAFGMAFAVLAGAASPLVAQGLPSKDKFHIFVLMGQSNMHGNGKPVPEAYKTPDPRVLNLQTDGKWVPAVTPLDKGRAWGFSPGESFGRGYAELHPGVTVGLIMVAQGGDSIQELSKGAKDHHGRFVYDDGMKLIQQAMGQGTIKAVLWHQGEANCGDKLYPERLKKFVAVLREDLRNPELPFIAGELGRFASWTAQFNQDFPAVLKAIPRTALASSEGLCDGGDSVHFSGEAAEALGRRYLAEYLKMVEPQLASKVDVSAPLPKPETAATGVSVANGAMSDGNEIPDGWKIQNWKGSIKAARDALCFKVGPASLRLESADANSSGCVSHSIDNFKGTFRVKGWLRTEGANLKKANVAVQTFTPEWKAAEWFHVAGMQDSADWKRFDVKVTIPDSAAHASVLIMIEGEGKAWLDEVELSAK